VALGEIGRSLAGDIRVVVIRAAGRAFSAGLDRAMFSPGGLSGSASADAGAPMTKAASSGPASTGVSSLDEVARLPAERAESLIESWQRAFGWLRDPNLISVAAVQGHAIGAGFQLALACDLRVLADDAQLCMAEPTLGLVPDLGGTKPLVELVGYARALEICVTGRHVAAAEAERIGLANLVVPREQLDAAIQDLTAALLEAPRAAVTETKALLAAAGARSQAEQEAAERAAQVRLLRGLSGFAEG